MRVVDGWHKNVESEQFSLPVIMANGNKKETRGAGNARSRRHSQWREEKRRRASICSLSVVRVAGGKK